MKLKNGMATAAKSEGQALSISEIHHQSDVQVDDLRWQNIPTRAASRNIEHAGEKSGKAAQLYAKRFLDIAVSFLAILVLLPLLLVLIALIRLDSPGSPLFRQRRWGKDGRVFHVYKFRSMRVDLGDVTGVAQTVYNDPRVTRIGALLRRTNLDELPQLFNVLKGDMSLVGPRCHAIGMLAAGVPYEELVPNYHERHRMRPGITGLAQMRGLRGPTDRAGKARARIASDLFYIENFSLALDIRIILGTIASELRGGKGF